MELTAGFRKTFPGGPTIEAELALDLGASGLTVLFGPSGCGKTTVLRCLAGLETPDAGRIAAGDAVWFEDGHGNAVPAQARGVGFVFQEPLLFPHLTVAGNIAYGLRDWSRSERGARVAAMARLAGLEGLEHRRPRELSGGQKQRVALARALAPRPRLVLLDEPFASLDRAATEELRRNLRHILHRLEVPAVLVTHNPVDALALGDHMVLMDGGRVLRQGTPAAILAEAGGLPAESFGSVARARVAGRVEGLLRLETGRAELYAPDPGGDLDEVYACVRGEGVSLERGPHGRMTQRNRLPATILRLEEAGALVRVHLDAGFPLHALITAWAARDMDLREGEAVQALIKASAIQVIPIEG
ncbi:MAG TPA: ABC transporter ATP-binding protein [Holophaga sp.]|nr:ABC transporter ATP-binding protein [Holophaga sp.]